MRRQADKADKYTRYSERSEYADTERAGGRSVECPSTDYSRNACGGIPSVEASRRAEPSALLPAQTQPEPVGDPEIELDTEMATAKFRNIVLFGPPGVGKGAQAQILGSRYGLVHLSTGAVIRDEIKQDTELGQQVKAAVEQGQFADDEVVIGIIMSRLDSPEFQNGWVMDGFPRTVRQAERFDQILAERDKSLDCALFFHAPEEVIFARLDGRRICSSCGATYHKLFNRPRIHGVCDKCQGVVVRRHDDSPEVHRARLKTYCNKTAPLEEYYRSRGKLFIVNAHQSIQAVAKAIADIIGEDE